MKNILIMLLLTTGMYAQQQVFNVQQYCIDEMPLKKGECDIKGNEYSFVFLDASKHEVVLFLSDNKWVYQITNTQKETDGIHYTLKDEKGITEMKVNSQKTRIEFIQPNRNIFLTVGKSTKL